MKFPNTDGLIEAINGCMNESSASLSYYDGRIFTHYFALFWLIACVNIDEALPVSSHLRTWTRHRPLTLCSLFIRPVCGALLITTVPL